MAKPWRDEELVRRLYWEEGLSTNEIGKRLDCSGDVVLKWMRRNEIPRRTPKKDKDNGWRDEETLRRLYVDEKKSTREIADELGCKNPTIHRWLHKHGIETRQSLDDLSRPPNLKHTKDGYEVFNVQVDGKPKRYLVHRLTAIAMGDLSPSDFFNQDIDVHHKNQIPWDNRPDNLEVMKHDEHRRMHRIQEANRH